MPDYPSSGSLIVTFLENVKRYRVNIISGINPSLINFNGIQMYVYIRNLSPAQLSNDNPDIWRIQLPKRDEFELIKKSDKHFILLGYDHIRKVYTSWNPYWCKQRLNVAESCSMYSRFSLQKRVSSTQKIEKLQLQNDGDVVCIPASLLGKYLKNLKEYYPEESTYIPVGSSIQKRILSESKVAEMSTKSEKVTGDKSISNHNKSKHTVSEKKDLKPTYTLDKFGKLDALDSIIIEKLLPQVRGVDYPDYESIIKQVKEYYPPKATEKMTPVDWRKLFDSTKWQKKRGRKPATTINITERKTSASIVSPQSKTIESIYDKTYYYQNQSEEIFERASEQEADGITTSRRVAEDIMSETQDNNIRVLCEEKVGWTMDVWKCVEQIPNDIFRLEDVYTFAEELQQKYPNNKTIKASIRQKLQILREKGYIEFVGGGKYRKLNQKSFSHYAGRIVNLKQAKINGEVIVAKPVLLHALIDGVDKDVFDNNHFYLNDWLEERYLSLMKEYTKGSQFPTPTSINNPFWHLTSDGFWHLHLKEKYEGGATPTKTWLKDNLLYASLDDDLWALLKNQELRNKMRNVIIDLINSQKRNN